MVTYEDHAGQVLERTLGALPISVEGVIVRGDQRGRELGFPTANIDVDAGSALPEGVFAGYAERADGRTYFAAISIGHRETFYGPGAPCLVEVHLLDFDGDLYGELLRVSVVEFIRVQWPFSSLEELIAQIRRDVADVRALLGALSAT